MSSKLKNILDEYIEGLFNILGNNIEKVILYGSYAEENKVAKKK